MDLRLRVTAYLPPNQPRRLRQILGTGGGAMGKIEDFGDLGFVANCGLARFCGPCMVEEVSAEEVLRVGTWTPSAIPPGEEILV